MADDSRLDLIRRDPEFDPVWYLARYPDVAQARMDPAAHFARYGHLMNRDPGPTLSTRFVRTLYNIPARHEPLAYLRARKAKEGGALKHDPGRVLMAANEVAEAGDHERAIILAASHLDTELGYTVDALRANAALGRCETESWLAHLNRYLSNFGDIRLVLEGAGTAYERLATDPVAPVIDGPLVSVIMPAWNSEKTLLKAAGSVLAQSWRNLELLIVDDASTDGTWKVMQGLAAQDPRVRILRNQVNVGPYVSKNIALTQAKGDWITGHDADDWAVPRRIEQHMAAVLTAAKPKASLTYMIRIQPDGMIDSIGRVTEFSPDGVARVSSISTLFERDFMQQHLGHWDSVRFAADSEMIARARTLLGAEFKSFRQIGMICLNLPTGLTRHPELGVTAGANGGLSPTRQAFKAAWTAWHKKAVGSNEAFMPFPIQGDRPYAAPDEMIVPLVNIQKNLGDLA